MILWSFHLSSKSQYTSAVPACQHLMLNFFSDSGRIIRAGKKFSGPMPDQHKSSAGLDGLCSNPSSELTSFFSL